MTSSGSPEYELELDGEPVSSELSSLASRWVIRFVCGRACDEQERTSRASSVWPPQFNGCGRGGPGQILQKRSEEKISASPPAITLRAINARDRGGQLAR